MLQYSLDKCCSVSEVCKAEEVAKLHKCHYRGNDYHLGQRIYPENAPCYMCICDTEFDNSTSISANKHCQKVDCGIELRSLERVMEGCVPVYFGDNGCCPIEFRCRKCIHVTRVCGKFNDVNLGFYFFFSFEQPLKMMKCNRLRVVQIS